jgi:hypothetical protein
MNKSAEKEIIHAQLLKEPEGHRAKASKGEAVVSLLANP